MIVDANVLLYSVDADSPRHARAVELLEAHLNGDTRVGLPWQSLSAFLRIATHPRVMANPLSADAAAGFVDDWLAAPAAWVPDVSTRTWEVLGRLLRTHGITGNLVPDAQLAALAIQHGVPVVSADTDFARFPEVRWVDPFTG
ncbi:PIN domain-containing protein [Phycicoccus sp. CSK15P-2]|uniref:TA system VapC family ribonuclease toxin n=1 Tax=Phycicoccus sp. CSK15P-2 TaxID=2807627 RepID=UPI001950A559|nr:TA system VapC family ribonuclease toxin [Phycicoccus sp. CSK15P-2]MBM6403560.1 PIN domain-containing protein [Phycicoccus sp. CSK15P-2]